MAPRYVALALLSLVSTPVLAAEMGGPEDGFAVGHDRAAEGIFEGSTASVNHSSDRSDFKPKPLTAAPIDPSSSREGAPSGLPQSSATRTTFALDQLAGSSTEPDSQPAPAVAPVATADANSLFQPGIWGTMMLGAGAGVFAAAMRRRHLKAKSQKYRSGRGAQTPAAARRRPPRE